MTEWLFGIFNAALQVKKRDKTVMENIIKRGKAEIFPAISLHRQFIEPIRQNTGWTDQSHKCDFHINRFFLIAMC